MSYEDFDAKDHKFCEIREERLREVEIQLDAVTAMLNESSADRERLDSLLRKAEKQHSLLVKLYETVKAERDRLRRVARLALDSGEMRHLRAALDEGSEAE